MLRSAERPVHHLADHDVARERRGVARERRGVVRVDEHQVIKAHAQAERVFGRRENAAVEGRRACAGIELEQGLPHALHVGLPVEEQHFTLTADA